MGAYSELDAALREDGDFVDDDFAEDNDSCAPPPAGTGNVPRAEPVSDSPAQPVQPQPAAPAQPAGDKADKAEKDQTDEDAKRKAHEEAEAQRKAEWDAKQRQKKDAEKLALAKLDAMSDDEVLAASLKRVGEDTEKLTRRNMKECVMEHIQTLCLGDPTFARKVMHPRKNMIRCFQYINRKAWEYVQDEMKANGIQPGPGQQAYASDIPDGVCYQWAVDYFNDPNAKEDEEKEEKFVPRPYRGPSSQKAKGKADTAKNTASKNTKPAEVKKRDEVGQISFGDFSMPEEKAG